MLRTILSYAILILVPAISLAIAILPYWRVKKACHPVSWKHLWIALLVGLVGNVGWWTVFDQSLNEKIAIYLRGGNDAGIMFSFFLHSFFLVITPFIFSKLRYGKFTVRRTIISALCSLLTMGVVIGTWIVLAIIGYRGIFYQLN